MHHLHIIIVEAETPAQACTEALRNIDDWGSDNNWRVACGSINKATGNIFDTKEGRYPPEMLKIDSNAIGLIKGQTPATEGDKTLAALNKYARDLVSRAPSFEDKALEVIERYQKDKTVKIDGYRWFYVSQWAKDCQAASYILDKDKFDPWADSYKEYEYGEQGITSFLEGTYSNKNVYAVFIDMHT